MKDFLVLPTTSENKQKEEIVSCRVASKRCLPPISTHPPPSKEIALGARFQPSDELQAGTMSGLSKPYLCG